MNTIIHAKNIYILGVRSASALSGFMNFYFNQIFDSVRLVNTTSTSEMFEQIMRIKEGDVFIGDHLPTLFQTNGECRQLLQNKAAQKWSPLQIQILSPIAEMADHLLLARSDMASFVDSLVAPLSVINALLVAIGIRKKDEISSTYERLEQIWDEYNVYEKNRGTTPMNRIDVIVVGGGAAGWVAAGLRQNREHKYYCWREITGWHARS